MDNLGSIPAIDIFFISEIIQYLVKNLTDCYETLWEMSSPYLLLENGACTHNYEEKD